MNLLEKVAAKSFWARCSERLSRHRQPISHRPMQNVSGILRAAAKLTSASNDIAEPGHSSPAAHRHATFSIRPKAGCFAIAEQQKSHSAKSDPQQNQTLAGKTLERVDELASLRPRLDRRPVNSTGFNSIRTTGPSAWSAGTWSWSRRFAPV